MVCEFVKIALSFLTLTSRRGGLRAAFRGWDLTTCLSMSGIASASYAAQNVLIQLAYQALDSITFNCLNQTKVGLCVYAAVRSGR